MTVLLSPVVAGAAAAVVGCVGFALGVLWQGHRNEPSSGEYEQGYEAGLIVGRAGISRHRTYIVDVPTFQRIREREFLDEPSAASLSPDALASLLDALAGSRRGEP